jgi:uncharacterized protein YecE (DUF72 family)
MPASGMLAWYAERFPAVEINNTFYRIPRPDVLETWATEVPAGFVFVFKASRWITHMKRLLDPAEPIRFLLDNTSQLGAARGPFLFQLPPNMKKDAQRLADFLAHLPSGVRAAFEFRHPSWHDDDVFALLGDARAALVIADVTEDTTPRVATADWGYLRLRREAYDDADLARWADWIHACAWTDCFTFFKHEDAGTGPALARRFAALFNGSLA